MACDGAKDDVGSRCGSLFLEFFPLCKVSLLNEAGLSFVRRLYAQGGRGVKWGV